MQFQELMIEEKLGSEHADEMIASNSSKVISISPTLMTCLIYL